jgi:hypothetical protein
VFFATRFLNLSKSLDQKSDDNSATSPCDRQSELNTNLAAPERGGDFTILVILLPELVSGVSSPAHGHSSDAW